MKSSICLLNKESAQSDRCQNDWNIIVLMYTERVIDFNGNVEVKCTTCRCMTYFALLASSICFANIYVQWKEEKKPVIANTFSSKPLNTVHCRMCFSPSRHRLWQRKQMHRVKYNRRSVCNTHSVSPTFPQYVCMFVCQAIFFCLL